MQPSPPQVRSRVSPRPSGGWAPRPVTSGPAPRPRRSRRGRALAPAGRDSISETNVHPSACHPTKARTRTCRLALPRVRSGPRRRAADTGGQQACHSPASRGVPASIPGARAGRSTADAAGRGRAAVSSGAGRDSPARPRRAPTARRAARPGAERSGGAGLPRQLLGARASHRQPLGSCLGVQFPPEPGPGRARAGGGGPQTVPLLIQVNKAMDGRQSPPGSVGIDPNPSPLTRRPLHLPFIFCLRFQTGGGGGGGQRARAQAGAGDTLRAAPALPASQQAGRC